MYLLIAGRCVNTESDSQSGFRDSWVPFGSLYVCNLLTTQPFMMEHGPFGSICILSELRGDLDCLACIIHVGKKSLLLSTLLNFRA